jgi:XRE family transcriptional regulator, stress-response regulator
MLLRHAIGSALRRLRRQRGLTLRELSEASRVSLPYLSEVERGRKEVSSELLSTICIVLGLSVSDLLRETDVEFAHADAAVLDIRTRIQEPAVDDLAFDEFSRQQFSRQHRAARAGEALLLAA